jgi:hypothetical protein
MLNSIFPEEMEIRPDNMWFYQGEGQRIADCMTITRFVQPSAYPVYVGNAAAIIKDLVDRVSKGRVDRRQTSAEVLALCWLCLSVARLRIPVNIKELLGLSWGCLVESDQYAIKLPTQYQEFEFPIPRFLGQYLNVLQGEGKSSGKIFTRSENSLYRELKRVITSISDLRGIGGIGFEAFLTPPHEVKNHRYQPKKKRPKSEI